MKAEPLFMKSLILMYAQENAWAPEDHAEAIKRSVTVCQELSHMGRFHGAAPLGSPSAVVQVRKRAGDVLKTDGPFIETKELLGGFFLIDADDQTEAVALAARLPGAERGVAEIWPVNEVSSLPLPYA